ncbi:MAG: Transcriptional regulator, IclR family [Holophagaceae bacterium]|nr:Transcriptional regulator, IclR family [Holophagaceae bacterium]
MTKHEENQGGGIQALNRAVDILRVLGEHPGGLTIRKLAGLAGLSPSTTQRIIATLEASNLVMGSAQGFRLGPTVVHLARSVRPFDVVGMVHPLLLQLASATGESASLAVLSHGKAVVVDQASGRHALTASTKVGSSLPLHSSACGKALLAALPHEDLENLRIELPLAALTHRTIIHWPQLLPELESTRARGLAFDHQENALGICAIAISVPIPGPVMTAVSVPIPTSRYREVESLVCEALKECRQILLRRWHEKPRNPLDAWVFPGKGSRTPSISDLEP